MPYFPLEVKLLLIESKGFATLLVFQGFRKYLFGVKPLIEGSEPTFVALHSKACEIL